MKNVFKTVIRMIGAVMIAGIMFFVLDGIFAPKYVSENIDGNVTAEFYEVPTPIDATYFGSSTVYNAIAPDYIWNEYGIASYVRANASQTVWQSYYMIRDTVRRNKPSLITLDMSFMKYGEDFFEEGSNRKTIDGMKLSADKLGSAKASMYFEENLYSYIFPVLRFHSRWDDLKDEDFKYAFKRPQVTYDGFIMEFGTPDEMPEFDDAKPEETGFPPKATEYLEKTIDLCEKENIDLLLMKTPTYINNWYPEYDEMLLQTAEGHDRVEYVNFDDYAQEMGIDRQTDYVDGHSHLNVYGAEKFSRFFGQYIQENYGLKDHRGEENYAGCWNERYERYKNAKEMENAPLK